MKKSKITLKAFQILFLCSFVLVFTFCNKCKKNTANDIKEVAEKHKAKATVENNPFFKDYDTPFNVPIFSKIKEAHYMPAFKKGMKLEKQEINAIVNNPEEPTFKNTLIALEKTGELLSKVSAVFWHMNSIDTTDGIQKIAKEVTPLLSKHENFIALNDGLFQRIKALYQKKNKLSLNDQEMRLLERTHLGFIRSGADLKPEDKEKVKKINEEMSKIALQFRNNLLKETNNFKMFIDKKEDLAGLPQNLIDVAAEVAKKAGYKSKWAFTPHKPSWIPFLQNSPKRELREKLYKGYIMRGDNNNKYDNKKLIAKLASLRVQKANIMGYKTHADYRLKINMSKKPENVYKLLNRLWEPALNMAKKEVKEMQAIIDKEGGNFKLASWDWWYYAEKVRKEKYALDESKSKPYFEVNNVREGAFYLANKLYGITFTEFKDLPKAHKHAKAFEVKEVDGTHIGILYTDYFYRESKRSGAWCGDFQGYSNIEGKTKYPIIYNVCNFPQPVGDTPSLLSFDQASTLFHEFGHALHSLFNRTTYPGISWVARDFVELPSQIMEHWCAEPEVLRVYAKHYKTGKSIPQELIDKLQKSSHFNQGFVTVEYLAAALLDMNYHTLTDAKEVDTLKFENDYFKKIGLIPEIISRYRSTYFQHIVGGYDAGYHAYIWAEVLDCDAFEAFKETSLFDKKTAESFRKNILANGGKEDEAVIYKRFRGRDAKIDGLLKKRGLK